jgi:hypothetical protein
MIKLARDLLNAVVCSKGPRAAGRHFRPPPSPWRSAAATRASRILHQRGADVIDIPGGASGLLRRDYKGKEAARLVIRIDPRVVSLVAELRSHERRPSRNWASGRPAAMAGGAADGRPSLSRFPPLEPGSGPGSAGRRHGGRARRRQRVAGARLQGQEADKLVTRIDPGVVSLVAELRAHERHAAEKLEQWRTHHEERKVSTPRRRRSRWPCC